MRTLLWCVVGVVAISGASCRSSHDLYPVSGTVTYKGAPAAGAVVFFQRQGADPVNEHLIMGIVQQDGAFSLVCGPYGAGAPPGAYDVLIEWKENRNQPKGLATKAHDRLKARYADPKTPRLHAIVKAETNRLPPFDLTD